MLKKIKSTNILNFQTLFNELIPNDLSIISTAEGNCSGELWVDNKVNPSVALMYQKTRNFYIVGNNNKENTKKIVDTINSKIKINYFFNSKSKTFRVFCDINWENSINEVLPNLTEEVYLHYKINNGNYTNTFPYPLNYTVFQVDKTFLNRSDIENFHLVFSWIDFCWKDRKTFLKKGTSFCAIDDKKYLSSISFLNYIAENRSRCEIGINTDRDHRRRGLGKLLSALLVEYCSSKGFQEISWHCNEKNIPSIRTAESIGFILESKYKRYYGEIKE